ncbi:hydroxyethylthiazole kinase [Avibacterium paragallinarum]|uniref:hydroxyethylthiazole kinase n=1 Tax=Avibacterium paragallinarum TaxID=728 RepID=UPI0021F72E0B|nr:hydroxyethylthiazole kinase [Avibacterium paragallinarum]UXN37691.1 hydroxyethylthiazole kinase [Avibacterium paragallinarum]
MDFNLIAKIRKQNPLIHNITNIVVANYVANGLLALGASPIMADAEEEMADLAKFSSVLVINIGTLDSYKVKAMLAAGKAANQAGIPVVLDPVGVGATAYRKAVVAQLLSHIKFTAIRGNAGEIAQLAGIHWSAKGVDAGQGESDVAEIAKVAAQQYQCVVAVSGKVDYLSDGKQLATIHNGTAMFPKITGSGCLLGAVIGAFLAVQPDQPFNATVQACTAYAVAGELAAEPLGAKKYGQFYTALLDQLGELEDQQVAQYAKVYYTDI